VVEEWSQETKVEKNIHKWFPRKEKEGSKTCKNKTINYKGNAQQEGRLHIKPYFIMCSNMNIIT
jgi:hypothetical protein